ncbi:MULTISPECIES: helix-turn-helix domain-containing protein [unclassified Curtobacterium]|uniref:helix-turn-helix domain-containing protein n=1 Tax=unclassified Curtobacterium TaxID=257496 RepID=UPI003A7FCC6E
MAKYLGVSRNSVSGWINGIYEPRLALPRLFATRTGVPFGWRTTGKPHRHLTVTTGLPLVSRHSVRSKGLEPPTF